MCVEESKVATCVYCMCVTARCATATGWQHNAFNKYIVSYIIPYIILYISSYGIISYIVSYRITYRITSHIIHHTISYHIIYYRIIISYIIKWPIFTSSNIGLSVLLTYTSQASDAWYHRSIFLKVFPKRGVSGYQALDLSHTLVRVRERERERESFGGK